MPPLGAGAGSDAFWIAFPMTVVFLSLLALPKLARLLPPMIAALIVSAVFLACYLTYHFTAPIFVFPGTGWVVPVYYAMLISHVFLAAIATPMIANPM